MVNISRTPRLRVMQPTSNDVPLKDRNPGFAQGPAQAPKSKPQQPTPPTPEEIYSKWKQDPTPELGGQLLSALEPHIAASARKYAKDDNPVLMGRAKTLVIAALPRFDAKRGANLTTFIDRQLQPLQRWSARKNLGVRVPTRDVQTRKHMETVSAQLEDELGRAPSIEELADRSGVNYETITKLNQQHYPQIAEREMASEDGSQMTAGDQAVQGDDRDVWLRAIYHDLGPVDQYIMQHTWGLYGANKLDTDQIARKLRVTPGRVSQRRARIDGFLQSLE